MSPAKAHVAGVLLRLLSLYCACRDLPSGERYSYSAVVVNVRRVRSEAESRGRLVAKPLVSFGNLNWRPPGCVFAT